MTANQSSDAFFEELLSNDPLLEEMTTLLGTMTEEQTALFRRVVKGIFSLAMQQNGLVRHLERLIRSEQRQRIQQRPPPVQHLAPIARTPIVLRFYRERNRDEDNRHGSDKDVSSDGNNNEDEAECDTDSDSDGCSDADDNGDDLSVYDDGYSSGQSDGYSSGGYSGYSDGHSNGNSGGYSSGYDDEDDDKSFD